MINIVWSDPILPFADDEQTNTIGNNSKTSGNQSEDTTDEEIPILETRSDFKV